MSALAKSSIWAKAITLKFDNEPLYSCTTEYTELLAPSRHLWLKHKIACYLWVNLMVCGESE